MVVFGAERLVAGHRVENAEADDQEHDEVDHMHAALFRPRRGERLMPWSGAEGRFPADPRFDYVDRHDLVGRHRVRIGVEEHEIGELTALERPELLG